MHKQKKFNIIIWLRALTGYADIVQKTETSKRITLKSILVTSGAGFLSEGDKQGISCVYDRRPCTMEFCRSEFRNVTIGIHYTVQQKTATF
jgi:hypothetical protein